MREVVRFAVKSAHDEAHALPAMPSPLSKHGERVPLLRRSANCNRRGSGCNRHARDGLRRSFCADAEQQRRDSAADDIDISDDELGRCGSDGNRADDDRDCNGCTDDIDARHALRRSGLRNAAAACSRRQSLTTGEPRDALSRRRIDDVTALRRYTRFALPDGDVRHRIFTGRQTPFCPSAPLHLR